MPTVRKAVIAAAGRRMRAYPGASAAQQALLPLVDRDGRTKPLIQIIAAEALDAGVEQVCIICQPGDEQQYREYFRRLSDDHSRHDREDDEASSRQKLAALGERLRFIEQPAPNGLASAIHQARPFTGDEPFLLLPGEGVFISDTIDRCAQQLIRVFETFPCDAVSGVHLVLERQLHQHAALRGQILDEHRGIYQAELIIDRPHPDAARRQLATPHLPAGNYLGHIGLHVLSPRIFESLDHLIHAPPHEQARPAFATALEHLRQQGRHCLGALVRGQYFDISARHGLLEAQLALALNGIHRHEICESIARVFATQLRS
jgi:UTP--glucose-1-phosphate uridylyltransferase